MFNLRSTRFYSTTYFRVKTNCPRTLKEKFDWDDPLQCDLLSRFENWQIELYLIKDGFNQHKGDTVELSIFTKYSSKYPSFVSSFIQRGFQTWVGNNTTC